LNIGDASYSMNTTAISSSTEIYKPTLPAVYTSCGKITHKATIQSSPASAASLLKQQNEELLREKQANRTTLIDINGQRSTTASPSSFPRPLPNLSKPKRLPLSSTKPLSSTSIHSLPNRAIHLLAVGPITSEAMAQKMKIPLSEVENLLKEYGTRANADGEEPELYRLADNRYKDLRVWEWKYSPTLRTQVIAAATKAFDILDIPKDHVYRRNLIDPKIKKAEAEAAAAEKDAQRRAAAEIEAAEKAAAEKLAFEKITEQAKAAKQAASQVRRQVSNPTSMLQKVTKIGTTNGPKRRSPSLSSSDSATTSPKALSGTGANSATTTRKSPVISDGDSPPPTSGPIISKTRKRLHPPVASTSTRGATSTGTPASRTSSFDTLQQHSPASPSTYSPPSPPASTTLTLLNPKKRKLPASSTPDVTIRTAKRPANETAKISASSLPSTLPSPPKPGTAGPDEDMFALAQMFREKYSVYEKLYRKISNSNNVVTASAAASYREAAGGDDRQSEKVRKLVSLHRELEQVKKRLWAMSPPGATSSTAASSRVAGTNGNLRKSSVKSKSR
jgi:hypothetical protein